MELTLKQRYAIANLLNTLNKEEAKTLFRELRVFNPTYIICPLTENELSSSEIRLLRNGYYIHVCVNPKENDFLIIRRDPSKMTASITGIGSGTETWYVQIFEYVTTLIYESTDPTFIIESICEVVPKNQLFEDAINGYIKELLNMVKKTRVTISFDYKGCSSDLQKDIDAFREIIGLDNDEIYDNVEFKFVRE